MRASFFYIAMMICSQQLLLAHISNGQGLDKQVTIGADNETLFSVVQKLKAQTDLSFVFPKAEYSGISFKPGKRTVKEVLDLALRNRNLSYALQDRTVVIYETIGISVDENSETKNTQNSPDRFSRAVSLATITGTIRDAATQEPLAGANIIVKGTTKGTTSDSNGQYAIEANENDILVFSFIGFETIEVPVNGRIIIEISLGVDLTALKEVVVNAGYWNVKEKENTGNISKITSEDIEKQPVSNVLGALEARMAGVYISQSTGVPGGAFNIQIRGQNSLRNDPSNNGNSPLYIIDGVPFTSTSLSTGIGNSIIQLANPLNNISPNDIESIEILKDADATSIYGSRGANGVVLITTKKGTIGKTKVDINAYSGVGQITRRMDLLNTEQYLEMRREAYKNDGATPAGFSARDLLQWDTTRYTDWQNVLIGGTAHITNTQASISGGNQNIQFLFGGGYYKESTVFPKDFGIKKFSTHFNLTQTSENKKLKSTLSASYVATNNDLPRIDLTAQAVLLAPNAPPIFDESGALNWANSTWANPFALFLRRKYRSNTDNLISNLSLSYELLKGLQLKSSLGFNAMQNKEIQTNPISAINPAAGVTSGSTSFGSSSIKTWIFEPQIEYEVGNVGKLNVLVGTTFQQSITDSQTLHASGFISDALLENIQSATSVFPISSYRQYRYNALFGRINYNWNGKYIVNLTGRRDGSSRFGPKKQFANFGAVGVAWIFSREQFFEGKLAFLSFGKLRASYGATGNDQIPDYGYMDTYSSTSNPYQGAGGLYSTRLVNPDYSWEVNKKMEAALDLGFLRDRIVVSVSWYRNRSSNQLVGYPLSVVTGQSSIQANLPATVQNNGWEFLLTAIAVQSQNIKWTTSVNLTAPKNKLVEYPNIEASSYANYYVVGQPLSIVKKYHYTGVNSETGIYMVEDFDGDGNISYPNDLQGLKKVTQAFFGGFQNSINYKRWGLSVFFQFVKQTGKNYQNAGFINPPGRVANQPKVVLSRWQKPGDITDVQAFSQRSADAYVAYNDVIYTSDKVIVDASFIRMKNLSLFYQLPPRWMNKIGLKESKIYIQAQNLFTITNYLGMDPENQNATVLPPLRVLTAGIQFTL